MGKFKKPALMGIILSAVAAVGFVLAIVGLAVDAVKAGAMGISLGVQWFDLGGAPVDIPGELLEAFAIILFIFSFAACVLTVLSAFGIVKLPNVVKFAAAALIVVIALLTVILTCVFVNQLNDAMGIATSGAGYKVDAAPFLIAIGSIATAVPLALIKE